ncbi:CotH kinase family protein, partial [Candidatus Sumerlaeota bacterium]|nr:CotH kinase family protein [Candidatus Sumerlaeota bacterium]
MTNNEKKPGSDNFATRVLNDWRVLALGLAVFCAIVLFVLPKKFFGIIHLDRKQSKVIRFLGSTPPVRSVIVINEIMYHPQTNKRRDEFIELYNTSKYRIALDGWKIRGIKFNFPRGTVIEPESYLVVAADPQHIRKLYGLPHNIVIGPYSGQLSNRGEKLQLVRPDGSLEDEVAYDDGVFWDPRADGSGPSLELINPEDDNSLPESWKASMTLPDAPPGTPGKQNSVFQESGSALISDVSFSPITPTSSDSIEVSCEVLNRDNLSSVTLFYRPSSSTTFIHIPMQENVRKYKALIPPQPAQTIIEFFIKAVLSDGSESFSPISGENNPYVFIIDDNDYTGNVPVYRIVMSPENYKAFTTQDIANNTTFQATFIGNNQAFLGVKVRYRGQSSRLHWKKSFHIEFSPHYPFEGRSVLNLNGSFWERQFTGAYLYSLTGIPTPEVKLVRLVFNGEDLQTYAQVEPVDDNFIARWFPNDSGGNLYRGVGGANLDFRGEDKSAYRLNYKKYNNKREDDYSDIIELCRAFSYPSDEDYVERLKQIIDLDEWITYFAATAALGNQEGIYYFPQADDFFLYRVPSSKKFVIIPWDFDSTCYPINEIISQVCTKNVKRFLFHPEIRPLFYRKIRDLLQETFKWENIRARIEPLKELTSVEKNYPTSAYASIEKFLRTRIDTFRDTFPEELTARILTSYADTIIPPHTKWEIHVGWFDPPSCWKDTQTTFTWYAFPAGMGYNHKSVKSFYDFADYTSLYIRKYFTIPEYVSLDHLRLCVEYSAGFVAYLNGTEVARRLVGKSGVVPSSYEKAQFFKKNAEPELFDLTPFKDLIRRDKKNILAVQAYIHSPEDSYFVIHPWLLAGGPIPYRAVVHPDNKIKIGGTAPVFETDEVLVNGEHTKYDAVFGKWST